MSSKERSSRPPKKKLMTIDIQDHWPPLDLNCSHKQHCHGARQLRSPVFYRPNQPLVMSHSVDIGFFDIRPLVKFVEQFPCPTCQHSGYDLTVWRSTFFTCMACGVIMNLKNTYGENINLHLKQGAAMKAGFCGID